VNTASLIEVLSILGTKEMIAAKSKGKSTGFPFDFAAILLEIRFLGALNILKCSLFAQSDVPSVHSFLQITI